ncbi:unnamed protein product [Gulo gulo]|uniref:Uncharacterized protein n=1 Tax=Gulo gulo TaxID=48420 RepID=A0A9X9LP98_GULGU|nr:unnamed protein product [Gulo gulo]
MSSASRWLHRSRNRRRRKLFMTCMC